MKVRFSIYERLFPLFVILLPTLPLLNPTAWFYHDWEVHSWLIAYTVLFIKAHWAFPTVFNFAYAVGFPLPLFYATTLYPIIGLLSLPFGTDLGIRFAVWMTLLAQYFSVRTLFRSSEHSRRLAPWTAALSLWAIYPMTNLFNRSAIPEYFALSFLTTGISQFILLLQASKQTKHLHLFSALLALGLVVTTHPITALYTVILSVPILLVGWKWSPIEWLEKAHRVLHLVFGLVLIGSAWIYVCAKYQSALAISLNNKGIHMYHDIDVWYSRLMPFPFDFRTIMEGASRQETPYLEAQINFSLLILVVFLARRVFQKGVETIFRNWDSLLLLILVVVLTVFSTNSAAWKLSFLVWTGKTTQFMYRLTGFINILLLLLLYALAKKASDMQENRVTMALTVALTLAVTNIGIKTVHALSCARPGLKDLTTNGNRILNEKNLKIPVWDYEMDIYPSALATSTHIDFSIDHEKEFGEPHTQWLVLQKPTLVRTNVIAFPWNKILVDKVQATSDTLFQYGPMLGVRVPAGKHELAFYHSPDYIWRVLITVSRLTLTVSFLVVGGLLIIPKIYFYWFYR